MVDAASAELARAEGHLDEAVRFARAGVQRLRADFAAGPPQALGQALSALAHLVLSGAPSADHLAEARAMLTEAARDQRGVGDMPVLANVVVAQARLLLVEGDAGAAAQRLGMSERLRGVPAPTDPNVVELTAALSKRLGDAAFAEFFGAGLATGREDILALVSS